MRDRQQHTLWSERPAPRTPRPARTKADLIAIPLLGVLVLGSPVLAGIADFDGDGFADLAIGVAGESVGGESAAGAVNILYGSASGLSAAGDQLWHRDVNGVLGLAESGDRFGTAPTAGDFDGDGYSDLAVGVVRDDVDGIYDAGSVQVFYGSWSGLTEIGDQIWSQNTSGVKGLPEDFDLFGDALAAGDFDGDGRDDLAIGTPFESVDDVYAAGAVNVLYGSASGLTASGDQLWHQNTDGVLNEADEYDQFGSALAAGDFDCDGYYDLAIGVMESHAIFGPIGAVAVLYGSSNGLTATGDQHWDQDSPGVKDSNDGFDFFGNALVAGDFDGDDCSDLAIGVKYEEVGGDAGAGAVSVLYGSEGSGLTASGDQFWHQDSTWIEGAPEERDHFGSALAACDFDGDGYVDVAIGVGDESVDGVLEAGAVSVIYGSADGLTEIGDQLWHQNRAGIRGAAEEGDHFGSQGLAGGDFNGDGSCDLAVGVADESVDGVPDAGAVNVLYGSPPNGLSNSGDQFWSQGSDGIRGKVEEGDGFGRGLGSSGP